VPFSVSGCAACWSFSESVLRNSVRSIDNGHTSLTNPGLFAIVGHLNTKRWLTCLHELAPPFAVEGFTRSRINNPSSSKACTKPRHLLPLGLV